MTRRAFCTLGLWNPADRAVIRRPEWEGIRKDVRGLKDEMAAQQLTNAKVIDLLNIVWANLDRLDTELGRLRGELDRIRPERKR